jgi:hypothetical protein
MAQDLSESLFFYKEILNMALSLFASQVKDILAINFKDKRFTKQK